MTIHFAFLMVLGFALHVAVGVAAGRVLAYLARTHGDTGSRRSQWTVYTLSLLLMLAYAYAYAAGHLAQALSGHDALLLAFAVLMALTAVASYRWRRASKRGLGA